MWKFLLRVNNIVPVRGMAAIVLWDFPLSTEPLEDVFRNLPKEAQPWTWWHRKEGPANSAMEQADRLGPVTLQTVEIQKIKP